ncbi:MAG: DMT family transporter [Salinivirgaceae bacterium]|nr:DMT family transporter [Salinivirgaceae bacterium]MDD4746568.1 DMT family transporter [Salinivirgaceae bacterium]
MFSLDKKLWQWLALLFLAFIWGGSFILMKRGLDAFSFVQVASMRIFFSFLILLPISIRHLKAITKQNIWPLLVCGVFGNLLPAYLFTLSETELSSSLAGILNALTPFFTVLIGVIAFKNRPGKLQYVGVIVGFLGAAILVTNGNFGSFGDINLFALFVVLATIFYGINVNVVRFRLSGLTGTQITSLMFFMVGPMAGIALLFTDIPMAVASPDFWPSLLATIVLATFGSVISMFIFNNLIHHTGAIFASSVTYIVPFFALMWGLFDNEFISSLHIYSMLIILAGVYLSSLKKKPNFKFLKR